MRLRHPDVRGLLTSAYHLSAPQIERAGIVAVGFLPEPYQLRELARYLRAELSVPARAASS